MSKRDAIAALDAAERLLRAAGVYTVTLRVRPLGTTLRGERIRFVLGEGRSLGNVYAKMVADAARSDADTLAEMRETHED